MGCTSSRCLSGEGYVIKSGKRSGTETPATVVDETVHEVSGHNHEAYSARVHVSKSLSEDYDVEKARVIGSGYSGPVRLGKSRLTGKLVAIKTFKKKMLTPKRLKFLRAEVSVYLLLDHPNVARLLGVYEDDNYVNIVMEYCSGKELYHRLIKRSSYSERDAAKATYDMLLALNYLHQHNVVHRDIKLENFIYEDPSETARLKLIDFGFSKLWYPDSENSRMQASCGSIQYVAPEVLLGRYTSQCDLWSMGVVVYMLLCGEPPFEGTEEDILDSIQRGAFSFSPRKWNNVSKCAKDFVQKLLVLDPDQRMTAQEALGHPWITSIMANHPDVPVPLSVLEDLRAFATGSHLRRAALSMLAYRLTSDEINELHEIFLSMDLNKEGAIQLGELVDVMTQQISNISKEEISEIFGKLDRSRKGQIEYTTFLAATLASRMRLHENLIRHVFDQLDADHDGLISLSDLRSVLGPTIDGDDISIILKEAHKDGSNGMINFEEFEHCFNLAEPIRLDSLEAPPPTVTLTRHQSIKNAMAKLRAVSALSKQVTKGGDSTPLFS
jgi:calcium-dependent protein kinase